MSCILQSSELIEAFVGRGFEAASSAGRRRFVRGHCEVHVERSDGGGVRLAIPVVRLGPERPKTPALAAYLEDRNARGEGPGRFETEGELIRYVADAVSAVRAEDLADLALAMQETVERTGPKVLNILRSG